MCISSLATYCLLHLRYVDAGSHSGIFCSAHKLENMVDVRNKHCAHPDCTKCPSFNYPGKTPGMYCGLHKQQGMVDVKHKRDRSHLAAGEGLPCCRTAPLLGSFLQCRCTCMLQWSYRPSLLE